MNIVLIGFKGSGKTTVGKMLAEELGFEFFDTDTLTEKIYLADKNLFSKTDEIYRKEGKEYFRNLESDVLLNFNPKEKAVLSTGGGVVLREDNRKTLKKIGKIIYLKSSKKALLKRLNIDSKPAFLDNTSFDEAYEQRKPLYESIADIVIETDNKTVEQIVKEIVAYGI